MIFPQGTKEPASKIVAIFLGSVFLGQGLSAALGGWAVARFSWREIFLAFSALSAVSFVSLFTLNFKDAPKSGGESFVKSIASLRGDAALLRSYFLALCNGVALGALYPTVGHRVVAQLPDDGVVALVRVLGLGRRALHRGHTRRRAQ